MLIKVETSVSAPKSRLTEREINTCRRFEAGPRLLRSQQQKITALLEPFIFQDADLIRLLDSKTWNGVFGRYECALRRATCKGVKHPNASYISIELTLKYEPAIINGGGEINRNFLAV